MPGGFGRRLKIKKTAKFPRSLHLFAADAYIPVDAYL